MQKAEILGLGGRGTGLHKIRHFSPKWGQPRLVTLIFHSKKNEKFNYLRKNISLTQLTKGHSIDCEMLSTTESRHSDYSSSLVLKAVHGKLKHVSVALTIGK